MNEIEIDRAIERVFTDNEERRTLYGAYLAEMEERLQKTEEDALTAYEGYAERATARGSGIGNTLAVAERIRAEVNELWAEIDKPAPDWSLFNAAGIT